VYMYISVEMDVCVYIYDVSIDLCRYIYMMYLCTASTLLR